MATKRVKKADKTAKHPTSGKRGPTADVVDRHSDDDEPQGGTRAPAKHRTPGKRGRLPKLAPADRLPLKYLHEYARAGQPLPAPSYTIDVTSGITDWGMLGNGPDPTCTADPKGVGDCTFAGRQHNRMAKAAARAGNRDLGNLQPARRRIPAIRPRRGQGCNIATLLLAWYRARKILAFAPVDHTDPAAVDAAMAAFTGTYCGGEPNRRRGRAVRQRPALDARQRGKTRPERRALHRQSRRRRQTAPIRWVDLGRLAGVDHGLDHRLPRRGLGHHHRGGHQTTQLIDLAALRADIDALSGTGG